jgi:hypothetical protein
MIPYDSYRLFQIERSKSDAEMRYADEQACRLVSAGSRLLRAVTRPPLFARGSSPSTRRAVRPA